MNSLARAGRVATKAAAVPVGLAALAQPAHADAVASPSRFQDADAWELLPAAAAAGGGNGDKLLFRPEEIDDALVQLAAAVAPGHTELASPASSSSPRLQQLPADAAIDALIEGAAAGSSWSAARRRADGDGQLVLPLDFDEISTVASKLLRQPGVQRELVAAALADPEVFAILASKLEGLGGGLPSYLASAGFAARGLLTGGPEAATAGATAAAGGGSGGGGGLARAALDALAEAVEGLGDAVTRLGRWLRAQLTSSPAADGVRTAPGLSGGRDGVTGHSGADALLGAAMAVCVAVVAVVLLRRPAALRALLRRAGRV